MISPLSTTQQTPKILLMKEYSQSMNTVYEYGTMVFNKVSEYATNVFEKIKTNVANQNFDGWLTTINIYAEQVEKGFNMTECVPLVCVVSSYLRVLAGKLQVLCGMIIASVGEIGKIACPTQENPELFRKFHVIAIYGTSHVLHGCLNIFRGVATGYLAAYPLSGFGNLLLLMPNLNNKFLPQQIQYDTVSVPPGATFQKPKN